MFVNEKDEQYITNFHIRTDSISSAWSAERFPPGMGEMDTLISGQYMYLYMSGRVQIIVTPGMPNASRY